jgi:hypothetical protein
MTHIPVVLRSIDVLIQHSVIHNTIMLPRYGVSACLCAIIRRILEIPGETPHFLVRWVLASLWRSQYMCLFSESRGCFA